MKNTLLHRGQAIIQFTMAIKKSNHQYYFQGYPRIPPRSMGAIYNLKKNCH